MSLLMITGEHQLGKCQQNEQKYIAHSHLKQKLFKNDFLMRFKNIYTLYFYANVNIKDLISSMINLNKINV